MWVLKLKGFDKSNIYGSKTDKHKVSMHYYPTNYYLENGNYYFTAIGVIEGTDKNIKAFFSDLKKDNKPSKDKRYVINLEQKGNFFVCITAQSKSVEMKKFVHIFYNPKFIHIKPAIIHADGSEEWNIATKERKNIEELLRVSREEYNGKILMLKKAKLNNVGILSILPELTDKQKNAFLLAVQEGYYEYPRKTELEKLCKLNGVCLSTYQAHLRKAERKLLPFIAKRYF